MDRKAIAANIKRQLWAECGGFCQNPHCNRYLFSEITGDLVSLANIAHIIGAGKNGPRSEHEIADFIEKNGISNLIMLCLDCHKIVDELDHKYTVEDMSGWKAKHSQQISSLFTVPSITDEDVILREVNDLLEENKLIFEEYGPFSERALEGSSGDTQKIWRRKCLDTILPNNQRIIDLIERNKRNFPYPWDLYREMLRYKIHADSFKENCLVEEKVNDYKLFPLEFDHFVKTQLGIPVEDLHTRYDEEIEYRNNTISTYINKFLANHSFIKKMEQWNKAIFVVTLDDGRELRVFVTNTYCFSSYTFEKILTVDPNIDVIICSNPYSIYSDSAKRQCIEHNVGLFMLKEFMGAIRTQGERFLNYLLNEEREERVHKFESALKDGRAIDAQCQIYLFGSYLRRKVFNDIDILMVYRNEMASSSIDNLQREISNCLQNTYDNRLDFTICSENEFSRMTLMYDNKVRIV